MGGLQLQMSWQASLLSQRRKTGGPLGLKNLGNSCYLNSVLQCLTYTPPLANFCLRFQHSSFCDSVANGVRKRECPFCILEKRIARSLSADLALDAPAKIRSCLRIFAEHFRLDCQEDAHEFLRYVIDACHNTCLRLKKLRRKGGGGDPANGDHTVVKEIFGGALQSQVKCLSCHSDSNKVDEIMDISLDVLNSNSLKEAMHKFFQPEILDGNNKYKCENCKKLVAARKQMSILQAPNILVIQLKRFEGLFGGKIDKAITFQEVLVLSSFMSKASKDPQPEYNLFGTIVHSGYSPESGHYYAYIKDAMGGWYCCNDSYVSRSTLKDVLSEKVYILFFCRTNQRPTAFASNGVESCSSNSIHDLKNKNVSDTLEKVHKEPQVEQSSRKDTSTVLKVNKVSTSPRVKFNILGNSGSKSIPSTTGKDVNVDKRQSMELNRHAKNLACTEKIDHQGSSLANGNGFTKNERCSDTNGEACQAFSMEKVGGNMQNGVISPGKSLVSEGNGESSRVMIASSDQCVIQNGHVNGHHAIAGSKRKIKDASCILLAKDPQSLAKVDELKKLLQQETSSFLRSCSWYNDVYNSMCSRKRLCAEETRENPSNCDLKKLLIADAKATSISRIPDILKEKLIKLLWSFSSEK